LRASLLQAAKLGQGRLNFGVGKFPLGAQRPQKVGEGLWTDRSQTRGRRSSEANKVWLQKRAARLTVDRPDNFYQALTHL